MRGADTIMHASAMKMHDLAASPGSNVEITKEPRQVKSFESSCGYAVAITCLPLRTDCTYGEPTHQLCFMHFTLDNAVSQTFKHL
jgi:hypothetical protein